MAAKPAHVPLLRGGENALRLRPMGRRSRFFPVHLGFLKEFKVAKDAARWILEA
jgi:hypothetical protein